MYLAYSLLTTCTQETLLAVVPNKISTQFPSRSMDNTSVSAINILCGPNLFISNVISQERNHAEQILSKARILGRWGTPTSEVGLSSMSQIQPANTLYPVHFDIQNKRTARDGFEGRKSCKIYQDQISSRYVHEYHKRLVQLPFYIDTIHFMMARLTSFQTPVYKLAKSPYPDVDYANASIAIS